MPEPTPASASPSAHVPPETHGGAAFAAVPCGCASAAESDVAPGAGRRSRVARMPQAVVATVLVVLLGLGYLVGGLVGGVLLALALLGFVVVIVAGWSALSRVERLLRIAVLACLVGLALVRVLPR